MFLPSDVARVALEGMPRRLRLQYPGAIYHLMARGNGRQDIVCDDIDRDRLMEHLGRSAVRCSWRIYAFAIMSNHLHVVLKTPLPNLSRGMHVSLSGDASGWSRAFTASAYARDRRRQSRQSNALGNSSSALRSVPASRRLRRNVKIKCNTIAITCIAMASRWRNVPGTTF